MSVMRQAAIRWRSVGRSLPVAGLNSLLGPVRSASRPSCRSSTSRRSVRVLWSTRTSARARALHLLPGAGRRRGVRRGARRHRDAARRGDRPGAGACARAAALRRRRRRRHAGRGRHRGGRGVALDAEDRRGALARARVERSARAARARRRAGAGAQHRQPHLRVRRRRRQAALGLPARAGFAHRARAGRHHHRTATRVYAGFPGGKLAAIALANGALRWEATVALPKGATELERVTDVIGDPAAQGREVCAAAYQGRVACFDAPSGKASSGRARCPRLPASPSTRAMPSSPTSTGAVHALDRSNGAAVWKQDGLAHRQLSLPLPRGTGGGGRRLRRATCISWRASRAPSSRATTPTAAALRAAPLPLPAACWCRPKAAGCMRSAP